MQNKKVLDGTIIFGGRVVESLVEVAEFD